MSITDSLFGSSKLPAYLQQLNKDSAQYQTDQMNANKENWSTAQNASQLGAGSDIGYQTATGAYLNANPYIDQVVSNATQQIADNYNNSYIPQAMSNFASSGRFGSGLMQQNLTNLQTNLNRDIGNAASNIYNTNYATERGYMENAQSRLGQQYDPLNRSSMYSNVINGYPSQVNYQTEDNPGIMGFLGAGLSMAGSAVNSFKGDNQNSNKGGQS